MVNGGWTQALVMGQNHWLVKKWMESCGKSEIIRFNKTQNHQKISKTSVHPGKSHGFFTQNMEVWNMMFRIPMGGDF